MSEREVYLFKEITEVEQENGKEKSEILLGTKGKNLSELSIVEGIPIPSGFTITTSACETFLKNEGESTTLSTSLKEQIKSNIQKIEEESGRKFGTGENPLTFVCRPSTKYSVSEVIPSFFNVGYNDTTVTAISTTTENPTFAHSTYRSYLQKFGTLIRKISPEKFDEVNQNNNANSTEVEELTKYESQLQEVIETESGKPFPQEVDEQLYEVITYLFEEWNSEQIQEYREKNHYSYESYIGVIVQIEVKSNLTESSGVGSIFSRNPENGDNSPTGTFLQQSNGLEFKTKEKTPQPYSTLEQVSQSGYEKMSETIKKIETHFKNAAEIEFAIENNEVYILGSRQIQTGSHSTFKILTDMANDGLISKEEAVNQLPLCKVESCAPETEEKEDELYDQPIQEAPKDGEEPPKQDEPSEPPKEKLKLDEEAEMQQLLAWSDEIRQTDGGRSQPGPTRGLGVRCNFVPSASAGEEGDAAPQDAEALNEIKNSGADGVVVCDTKLMLLHNEQSVSHLRTLILSDDDQAKAKAQGELVAQQAADYASLFESLGGASCVVRLPDLNIGEIVPDVADLAVEIEHIRSRIEMGIAVEEEEEKPEKEAEAEQEQEAEKEDDQEGKNQEQKKEEENKKEEKPPKPKPIEIKQRMYEKLLQINEINACQGIRGSRLYILFPDVFRCIARGVIDGANAALSKGQTVAPDISFPFVTTAGEVTALRSEFEKCLASYAKEKEAENGVTFRFGVDLCVVNAALSMKQIVEAGIDFALFDQVELSGSVYGYRKKESEESFGPLYKKNEIFQKQKSSKVKNETETIDSPFYLFDTEAVGKLVERAARDARNAKPEIELAVTSNLRDHEFTEMEFFHKIGINYISCRLSRLIVARVVSAKLVAAEKIGKEKESALNKQAEEKTKIEQQAKNEETEDTTTTETESTYDD